MAAVAVAVATMTMVDCPKCRVEMRQIESNGVTIELCPDCGGMFLDRGELEHLTQAERADTNRLARGFGQEIPFRHRETLFGRFDDDRFDRSGYRRYQIKREYVGDDFPHGDPGDHGGRHKRRGFLSEFLDFG